jgi:hypothetical protein
MKIRAREWPKLPKSIIRPFRIRPKEAQPNLPVLPDLLTLIQ